MRTALSTILLLVLAAAPAALGQGQLRTRPVAHQTAPEYEIKAAFLYSFAKYVDWPPQTFGAPMDPWVICVLGEDPFGPILNHILEGEKVRERRFVARRIGRAEEARSCHILFISSSEDGRLESVLEALRGSNVLTIGETEDFARRGGAIALRKEGSEIHFEINVDAAEQAELQVSAQLLKLAVNVIGSQGAR